MSYKQYTQEEINKANETSITELIEKYNLTLVEVSTNSYITKEHDSLKVSSEKNQFNWMSREKGGGPIQFVMEIENCTWLEAMKKLLGKENEFTYVKIDIEKKNIKEENKELQLPLKNKTYKHIYAYLNSRGIKKEIIDKFVKEKILYESVYKNANKEYFNATFIGYDKIGNPKYATSRSANSFLDFKGEAKGSDKEYSVSLRSKCKDDKLYVFESSIEAMSFLSLIQDGENFKSHIITSGGVSLLALKKYLNDNEECKTIICCTNNDEAGHSAYLNIKDEFSEEYEVLRESPFTYDFNNDLTMSLGLKTKNKEFSDSFLKACSFDKLKILEKFDTMKIEKDVIERFISEKKICLSQHGNILFLGYDNKKVTNVYCKNSMISEFEIDFEGFKEGSDIETGFSVSGINDTLYIFNKHEEMLSYMSLIEVKEVDFKGHLLVGGKEAIDKYIEKNDINKVVFCMNKNDTTQYKNINRIMKIHEPKENSFYNDLTIIKEDLNITKEIEVEIE